MATRLEAFGSSIPLPGASVDAITLHCSLEHFEGEEDLKFFEEGSRLLKRGGRICVIPLYTANRLCVITSPSVWTDKYKAYAEAPKFDPRAAVYVNEAARQRQMKLYDVAVLRSDLLERMGSDYDIKVVYYANHPEVKGCPAFALLLERK